MTILKSATNQSAYLKAGIMGFAGSGKTFTGSKIAVGLHKYIKSKKPIAFLDTETGSDYVLDMFKAEKIELMTAKSRAFVDLLNVTREAEASCDILIIDSITHFYDELISAYLKRRNAQRLRVQDWAPIKQEWRQFTELFINSKLHIIMNGRAGWTYDFKEDEEGITEIQKTGTKMKAETDMGYEPSLLLEMERIRSNDGKIGQVIGVRAWVLKDRFNQIQGKFFDQPTFENLLPHVKKLNLGGEHVGADLSNTSEGLFQSPDSRSLIHRRREIALEEIQSEMVLRWPGQSVEEKKTKAQVLNDIFGTGSWTAISELHPDTIEQKLAELKDKFPLTLFDKKENKK